MAAAVSRHHLGVSSDSGYGKYARPECERRFLLSGVPAEAAAPCAITDRYLRNTSLRLRRMEREGDAPIYKFGQKVRPQLNDPSVVMITNVYISGTEYEVLARLPADVVEKTRWVVQRGDSILSVDEFHGRHAGLILAEASFDNEADMRAFEPPALCEEEVTDDDRYSGGALARGGMPQGPR
jgi:CYTH domain-containing protein